MRNIFYSVDYSYIYGKLKDMAIKYKDLKAKLEDPTLSKEELELIDRAENYIDDEIRQKFKGGEVYIPLQVAKFTWDPIKKKVIELPSARTTIMSKELESRYKKAGWKMKIHLDDGLDGPNMSGPDWWILSGR